MLYLELATVFVLIVFNGLLSMSELAIVSSRPARLAALVDKGVRGSRRALALASDPGKFLSTVQIGITLIGVLSGAFSGATLGQRLSQWLIDLGLSALPGDARLVAERARLLANAGEVARALEEAKALQGGALALGRRWLQRGRLL